MITTVRKYKSKINSKVKRVIMDMKFRSWASRDQPSQGGPPWPLSQFDMKLVVQIFDIIPLLGDFEKLVFAHKRFISVVHIKLIPLLIVQPAV